MIDKKSITKVCIDDFAIKKRHKYGTIMVDIDTHKIIDMIESRDSDDVTNWLKTYPNLELICRDGANIYFNAVTNYNKNVIQISDRFHLIKNLTDYCKDYLYQYLKSNTELNILKPVENSINSLKSTLQNKYFKVLELIKSGQLISKACKEASMDIRVFKKINALSDNDRENYFKTDLEIKINEHEKTKQELIDKVRELYKNRFSISKIASMLEIDWRTAKKYIQPKTEAKHNKTGQKFSSKLDNYKKEIDELFNKNYTSKDIYQIIVDKGFKGSSSTLRHFLSELKKDYNKEKQLSSNYVIIKRKVLIQLIYKPLNKLDEIDKKVLLDIYKIYPNYKKIIELIREFKTILKKGNSDYLFAWIDKVTKLEIKELNSFINGINRDILAVINAVKYDYNNGLAEGSVNKTKLVKRIMYGRSSFETLKTKILRLEFC